MATSPIDFSDLGGRLVQPAPPASSARGAIDYDALAKQHGGTAVVDYDALVPSMGAAQLTFLIWAESLCNQRPSRSGPRSRNKHIKLGCPHWLG
jgi:hypothetical protein